MDGILSRQGGLEVKGNRKGCKKGIGKGSKNKGIAP